MKNDLPILMAIGASFLLSSCIDEAKLPNPALVSLQHAQVNGTLDENPDHKAAVALYNKNEKSFFCTGTLIHPQWVLTAAHCITDTESESFISIPQLASRVNHLVITFAKTEEKMEKMQFEVAGKSEMYYHPHYKYRKINSNTITIDYDIALIKLKEPVSDSLITPILPHPKWLRIGNEDLANGAIELEYVGYGVDEKGDSGTKLTFTSNLGKYCGFANAEDLSTGCDEGEVIVNGCHPNKGYQDAGYCFNNEKENVWMPYGSFYYDQTEGGPCQGDSGGPAFIIIGGKEYVSGVTSYGDMTCGVYGISTAVQDFYDWILSIAPEVATQYVEICDNGVDDDGDGFIDGNDADCGGGEDPAIDQDKIDRDAYENYADAGNPPEEICNNGIDDNRDGKIDCEEKSCKNTEFCTTSSSSTDPSSSSTSDDSSSCSAQLNAPATSFSGAILVLLGSCVLLRRRKNS